MTPNWDPVRAVLRVELRDGTTWEVEVAQLDGPAMEVTVAVDPDYGEDLSNFGANRPLRGLSRRASIDVVGYLVKATRRAPEGDANG